MKADLLAVNISVSQVLSTPSCGEEAANID